MAYIGAGKAETWKRGSYKYTGTGGFVLVESPGKTPRVRTGEPPLHTGYVFLDDATGKTYTRSARKNPAAKKKSRKPKKSSRSKIVSILFDEERWTVAKARRWLKDHKFRYGRIKQVGLYIHAPQVPAGAKFKRYATKEFGTGGIKARLGF